MVSSICIVSVEICCFQQLNRHSVFRRGRVWGRGRPAGRAGAGSPSGGLRSAAGLPAPARGSASPGTRAAPPRPGRGHTREGSAGRRLQHRRAGQRGAAASSAAPGRGCPCVGCGLCVCRGRAVKHAEGRRRGLAGRHRHCLLANEGSARKVQD